MPHHEVMTSTSPNKYIAVKSFYRHSIYRGDINIDGCYYNISILRLNSLYDASCVSKPTCGIASSRWTFSTCRPPPACLSFRVGANNRFHWRRRDISRDFYVAIDIVWNLAWRRASYLGSFHGLFARSARHIPACRIAPITSINTCNLSSSFILPSAVAAFGIANRDWLFLLRAARHTNDEDNAESSVPDRHFSSNTQLMVTF